MTFLALVAASVLSVSPAAGPPSPPAPLAAPATASIARTVSGPANVFGGDFTVPANEVLDGNVTVYGGDVDVEGTVTHDVSVFGGSVTINGSVQHDVRMYGGNLQLGPHAAVGHDVSIVGGNLNRDPGARVGHAVRQTAGGDVTGSWPAFVGAPFPVPFLPFHGFGLGFGLGLAGGVILLALLVHLFFPSQVETAREGVEERPLAALGFGCLTAVAGVLLAAFLGITIILLPVSLAIAVGMAAAWLLGLTAIAILIGQRLTAALNWRGDPVVALLLGGLLVAVLVNVPFLGGLVGLVAGSVAVGAAVLTRFGTRPAPPRITDGPPPAYGPPPPAPPPGAP